VTIRGGQYKCPTKINSSTSDSCYTVLQVFCEYAAWASKDSEAIHAIRGCLSSEKSKGVDCLEQSVDML